MLNQNIAVALVEALNTSTGAPLRGITRPRYHREIIVRENPDGTVTASIFKWGSNYKYRGPRLPPVEADTEGIKNTLNTRLPDWLTVRTVTDCGNKINIILEVYNEKELLEQS